MPSNKTELAARLALTRPADGVRGVFFRVVLEFIRQQGGPEALRQVTAGMQTQEIKDLRTFPAADYLRMLYGAADALEPSLRSEDAVFNACGRACVRHFATGPGQVVFGILGRGDPQRLFAQTRMAFSTVVTYGQRDHIVSGPNSCILAYRGDMQPPAYHVGIFEGALEALGFRGQVTAHPIGLDAVDYDVRWE